MRALIRHPFLLTTPIMLRTALLATVLGVGFGAMPSATAAHAVDDSAAPTVRADFAEPVKAVQEALQQKRYADALTQLDALETQTQSPVLSPYEQHVLLRFRTNAAVGIGDYPQAIRSYALLLDVYPLDAAERLATLDVLARLSYTSKQYPQAIEWITQYRDAGGDKAATLELLPQALYVMQRYREAEHELEVLLEGMDRDGHRPLQQQLQLLASCGLKLGDMQSYTRALKRMARDYPSHDIWLDLILRTSSRPGFARSLDLDVYRLRLQTGTLDSASDYMEAAQLSLQSGFPAEAASFLEQGYSRSLLGRGDATEVARQTRLKALVTRKMEEDRATLAEGERAATKQESGDALVLTGFDYVLHGQQQKGIALMRQGIAKGRLRDADRSQLQLGYAQWLAGDPAEAQISLASVKGADGTHDLAELLLIFSHQPR
jgi:tetratricopeptide (TPR) repeat protein